MRIMVQRSERISVRLVRQELILLFLLFAAIATSAQSRVTNKAHSPSGSYPAATKSPKPNALQSNFLGNSFDLNQTNLGPDFQGHDIVSMISAIKDSSALKEKSEFESTPAFEARRAGFVEQTLYGSITSTSYLSFVVGEGSTFGSTPVFNYDADSQILTVLLPGSAQQFVMDKDKPILDGILIRRVIRDADSYIGSNAFGAKVEVSRTYAEEFGVAFPRDNWLFGTVKYGRMFTYLLPLSPDEARAFKADAKLLLLCRMSPPWFRNSAHGHDATIEEPYETIVGDNYLQVEPEQLWIFHQKTGEVIRKLSGPSLARDADDQLKLKLRQTPVLLEISPRVTSSIKVTIDDEQATSDIISTGETKEFSPVTRRYYFQIEWQALRARLGKRCNSDRKLRVD
jgi:hypothetical protein